MAINSNNNVNENAEKKKNDYLIGKNKLIKDFTIEKLKTDFNNSFLEEIMKGKSGDNISSDLKKELDIFRDSKSKISIKGKNIYGDFDLDKIKISDLQKELLHTYVNINRNRDVLKKELLSEYEIDNDYISKKLEKSINNLSELELLKLIGQFNVKNRKNFLQLTLGKKNMPETVDLLNLFGDFISKINIQDRKKDVLSNLNEDEKDDLENTLIRLKKSNFSSEDLNSLFNFGFFNEDEKEKIIDILLPSISLGEALEFGIVDNDYVEKYKLDLVSFYKNTYNLDVDDIKSIISGFDDYDIYLSTKLNTNLSYQIDAVGRKIYFTKLDKESDEKEVDLSLENFLDKEIKSNTPEAKKEFLNFDKEVSKKIRASKFEVGNYLVINAVEERNVLGNKSQENYPIFFKILSISDDEIVVYNSGAGKIDLFSTHKTVLKKDFIEESIKNGIELKEKNVTLDVSQVYFETKKEIKSKIDDDKYVDLNSGLSKGEYTRLIEESNKNDDLTKEYIENRKNILTSGKYNEYKLKLDRLNDDKKVLLERYKKSNNRNLLFDIDEANSQISEIELKIDRELFDDFVYNNEGIKNRIDELNNLEETSKHLTFSLLKEEINEEDSLGEKYGLEKGVSFVTKQGIYTIANNPENDKYISLESVAGLQENISFEDFLTNFKELEGKRNANSNSFENMFSNLQKDVDIGGKWSDFEVKDGGIEKKETDNSIEYGFITSTESDELIKIHSISGDYVNISFGEYSDYELDKDGKLKRDNNGERIKKKTFSMYEGTLRKLPVSWLESWVKSRKGEPRSLDEDKDKTKENIDSANIKGSFVSRLFNRSSIKEVISGGKMFLESIESYLKEGNEEHATKFASSFLGKVLPPELQSDLMSRMEDSQKKRSDDYKQKLSNVDSWKATEMIAKWLLNKDTAEYKKEAGLLFMLEKYGVLYGKSGLHKYKGRFLWYEAMGGKVGDELYMEVKSESEKLNENFREEELIYKLMVRQCRKSGYNGVKRRSRLHKEVKKLRAVGKQGELETGKGDAKDERTVERRINGAIGELFGGTYPNAVGWLGEVVNKGGTMGEMNKVPFVMCFSGIGYGFEQNTLDLLKNFPSEGKMLPMLRLMSLKSDMKLLNETILELSKRLSELDKGKSGMYEAALKIFNNQTSTSINDGKKIENTIKFYDEYGDDLTRCLYMLNDGKTDEKSYLSKLIRLEKDPHKDKDGNPKEGNSIFKRYYDKLEAYATEYKFDEDELQSDAFAGAGTSGINMHNSVKALLEKRQGGGYAMKKSGDIFFKEIKRELEAIVNRDYGHLGEAGKRADLTHFIRGLISGLLEAHGGNIHALNTMINSNTSDFASLIHSKGLDFNGMFKFSSNDVAEGRADDRLIKKFVDILLEGKGKKIDHNKHFFLEDTSTLISKIKDSTDDTLFDKFKKYSKSANDDNYDDEQNKKAA